MSFTVTDRQIAALRTQAAAAGDRKMATICTRALNGSTKALAECARVIADAAAMADE